MSEGRKRSRKSKLVVRTDADVDETENTNLQAFPESNTLLPKFLQTKLKILDHTYSLQNVSTPPSPIQLSVKVEVEEFDESIMEHESEDTNDSTIMKPGPSTGSSLYKPRRKMKSMICVFQINLEKMYKVSDHITWSSTNLADKYLSIEMKNIWGRTLKPVVEKDPYNELIQKALHAWGLGLINGRTWRDSPLFYQCLLCKLAWWYLGPFRDHIRCHNYKTLKVYHLENSHESTIIASNEFRNKPIYIRCEGNCHRCGKSYDFHVKKQMKLYICTGCNEGFPTCSLLQQHRSICHQTNVIEYPKSEKCRICDAIFSYKQDLDNHIAATHVVRSDIPCPFSFKTCAVCQNKYHHFYTHMCMKSSMNSTCTYCYRKFATKMLADFHMFLGEKNYKCKICNQVLKQKCMETEHMLSHTDKYRMVYKCINPMCPPTMLFFDENSVKLHKIVFHKQKYDKRRTYFEKVLVPEQCAKAEFVKDYEHVTACELEIKSEKCTQRPYFPNLDIDMDSDTTNSQTDEQKVKEILREDIGIKQEIQDTRESDYTDGDSQDGEMDYEMMLSKVFKVSDTVCKSKPVKTPDIHIKTEPVDIDFEKLIDTQDNPITIKEELIDTYETDQLFSTQEPNYIDESNQFDKSLEIKTEPLEYDFDGIYDSDITAVKMEPEEIKQELIEATDIEIVDSFTEIPNSAEITPIRPHSPRSEQSSQVEVLMGTYRNNKSLLKKNLHINTLKRNSNQNAADSIKSSNDRNTLTKTDSEKKATNTKSDHDWNTQTKTELEHEATENTKSGRKAQNKTISNRYIKSKVLPNGLKQRRVYTCTKCGYSNNHRYYRIHMNSKCELTPCVDENNKYTCTKCDTSFSTMKSYLVHFHKHGYGLLHCPSCNMKFENLRELLPHFQKHVRHNFVNCWLIKSQLEVPTKKQQRCQECREIVTTENFFTHWESHLKLKSAVKSEPAPVEIKDEIITVTNEKTLPPNVLHIVIHQLRSVMREKECLVCYRQFSRRHDCKRHIIEHLLLDAYAKKAGTPDKTFRCQICLDGFARAEDYKFHMREHGALPVYRCDLCNKTFSDSSNFAKHKKIHSLEVLVCDICKKKFHAKTSLEKHMLMHQVTEPMICRLCSKKFYTLSHYNKHVAVRHERSIKFKCILCDIYFDTLRKKWDHAWAVHKERKQNADCPICHQGFRKYLDVKKHAKADHNVELSFFNIKSGSRMQIKKTYCKIKKMKTETLLIKQYTRCARNEELV